MLWSSIPRDMSFYMTWLFSICTRFCFGEFCFYREKALRWQICPMSLIITNDVLRNEETSKSHALSKYICVTNLRHAIIPVSFEMSEKSGNMTTVTPMILSTRWNMSWTSVSTKKHHCKRPSRSFKSYMY